MSGFTNLTSTHHWLKKSTIEYTPFSIGNQSSIFQPTMLFYHGETLFPRYMHVHLYIVFIYIFFLKRRWHPDVGIPQKMTMDLHSLIPPKWVPFNAENNNSNGSHPPFESMYLLVKKKCWIFQLCHMSFHGKSLEKTSKRPTFPRGKLSVNSFLLIIWFPAAPPSMKVKASWDIDESMIRCDGWIVTMCFLANYGGMTTFKKKQCNPWWFICI